MHDVYIIRVYYSEISIKTGQQTACEIMTNDHSRLTFQTKALIANWLRDIVHPFWGHKQSHLLSVFEYMSDIDS